MYDLNLLLFKEQGWGNFTTRVGKNGETSEMSSNRNREEHKAIQIDL